LSNSFPLDIDLDDFLKAIVCLEIFDNEKNYISLIKL